MTISGISVYDPDFLEFKNRNPIYGNERNTKIIEHLTFTKPNPDFNTSVYKTQTGGLLRIEISVKYGRIMLHSTIGLNYTNLLNTSGISNYFSEYPAPVFDNEYDREDHVTYEGQDGT